MSSEAIRTPDGRYLIVRGRLWRASNPNLPEVKRQALVNELMDARRAKKVALRAKDRDGIDAAKVRVQAAKEALGERGTVWWTDGSPDENRKLARNSSYAPWWASIKPAEE